MYRVAVLVAVIFATSLSILGQDPRVARPTPVPDSIPPVIMNTVPPTVSTTPPVLQTDTSAKPKPTATPTPASKDDDIIKVSTDLVTTPVSVLDRNGRFIPGLKQKDFKIFENNIPQKITYFQSEEQPFTVILIIDVSPSTKYKMDEIHFAAITFVNQLRATDKVMVVAFDQRVHVLTQAPTSEKQTIFAAIYKATVGSGTSLYEAVRFVTDLDLIKVPGRKAVVLLTDGVDTTSRQASFESTIAGVQEVDALIYPIRYNTQTDMSPIVRTASGAPAQIPPDVLALLAARGLSIDPRAIVGGANRGGSSAAAYAKGQLYLQKLAENSGGRIFEASDIKDLATSFAGVAEELRRQYSIGYYPEQEGQPGERRTVKIKVGRPNTVVRAKSSYVIRQQRSENESPAKSGIFATK